MVLYTSLHVPVASFASPAGQPAHRSSTEVVTAFLSSASNPKPNGETERERSGSGPGEFGLRGTKARTSITAGHVSQNGHLLLQERDDVRGRGRGGWRGGRPITGLESPPPDARPASCPPPSARPRARSLVLHRQLHRHLHPRYAERLLPLPEIRKWAAVM